MKRGNAKDEVGGRAVRCAIYTRKSTTEGLEQEFNSLDAQRDAAEAFIRSQRHEGWVALPEHYDDGGYSGADTDRPALKRLLADIEAGKLDCLVAYKVDRLTRSLRDFSRIVDVLERKRVSFVSVTQQFNTATSMGRLCLNMLLSFAEFEREQTAERTRDKVAAAKRNGRWTGGTPPLGYDVAPEGGKLVVNAAEAARVRELYDIYLEKQSLTAVLAELDRRGWTTKAWTTREGRGRAGLRFNRTTLHRVLTNPIYLGKVAHGRVVYAGLHEPILDQAMFDRVQQVLERNVRTGGSEVRNRHGALLRGIAYCLSCKAAMIHTYTSRGGRRYRYYTCGEAMRRGWAVCPAPSLPAQEVERFVVEHIRAIGRDPALVAATLRQANAQVEGSLAALDRERRGLEQEVKRHRADLLRPASRRVAPTQVATIQERILEAERRLVKIGAEADAARARNVDKEALTAALQEFERLWQDLSPREQARFVRLLVERVAYDGERETLAVTFRQSGMQALLEGVPAAEEATA